MSKSDEAAQIRANTTKLMTETMRLHDEAVKQRKRGPWLPLVWAAAFLVAVLVLSNYMWP